MNSTAPVWSRPPVIEVVLGFQFASLDGLTNAHLGLFWKGMRDRYPDVSDAAPIQPVLEGLGDGPEFGVGGLGLSPMRGNSRLRMSSADGTRMVQVQNGWLVVNWVKRPGPDYPGYRGLLADFQTVRTEFEDFVAQERLGPIMPNLWEVTYIDHIPKGTVWSEHSDIPHVLPGLLGSCAGSFGKFDALGGRWGFRLSPRKGRLSITLQSAQAASDPTLELLVLTSVARGPLKDTDSDDLRQALNFGRDAVVGTFMEVTSDEAKAYWKG